MGMSYLRFGWRALCTSQLSLAFIVMGTYGCWLLLEGQNKAQSVDAMITVEMHSWPP